MSGQTRTADLGDLVTFDGVTKTYSNGFAALAPVDLAIRRGEVLSVVGPSGCGKTTLLRMAAGLSGASTGSVRRNVERTSYVFQDPTLLAWRSVQANTELVARIRGVGRAERRRAASEALELVGLGHVAHSLPRELSGGMKMRVSLARALASDPELMLMDEPFAALDEFTRERMSDELLRLWRERGFGVMFITHSIREAVKIGHRVVVMAKGPGRVADVVDSPSPPTGDPSAPRDEVALDALAREIAATLATA
ncbi:ABC transporter ATP-binding protein [Kineococcus rhizosphaerae]|uniref:ABC transporter ATP-binding protein n=1 Tax=Kineococcus rhizosphaerae TaxID=559628 RepID=UPI000D04C8FB|nr:ABC transporter ATP-binding protein [Kineococcus rhizosphaerae]